MGLMGCCSKKSKVKPTDQVAGNRLDAWVFIPDMENILKGSIGKPGKGKTKRRKGKTEKTLEIRMKTLKNPQSRENPQKPSNPRKAPNALNYKETTKSSHSIHPKIPKSQGSP